MKNLITYLKTLWRRVADSQSTDVSLDCRRSDLRRSPSFHRRSTMLKLVSVLALIFTLGVGNAWGADPSWTWTAGSASDFGTSTSGNVTLNGKTWSVVRSSATNESNLNNSCVQLGAKNRPQTITLSTSAFSSYKVTKVEVECSSYGGNHSVAISVGGTSYLAATATASWTTVNTKYGTGTSTGNIEIAFSKNGSARALYIKSITVTYTSADCETLSAPGSPSSTAHATSVDLSWNSVANSSGYLVTFDGTEYNIASGTTTKTITGLKKEKTYAWTVAAKGDGSTYCALGTATSEQSVTTLDGCTDNKVTYTVASTSSVTPTDAPDGTSATFSNTYTSNKYQMTSGYSQTLTLTGYAGKKIKGVTLDMHSNGSAGAGTFSMVIGSTTVASIASATNFNEWYDNDSYGTDFRKVHVTLSDEVTVGTGESIVITIAATTNSLYCQGFALCYSSCTPLGSINGSINMSSSTDGTVTVKDWGEVSNASSYTVRMYKLTAPSTWTIVSGSAASGASGTQGTRTGITNRSTGVTYSGLEYGETYKFTVQAIGNGSSYCDGEETAVTSINGNSLTDNMFLNKYSIYIDDATNANYEHNYITSISSHAGSVDITLLANKDYYQYKLSLGGVVWWGNTGKMTSANCTSWTFTDGASNCKLQTNLGGTYTFALAAGTPAISVTYPPDDQASGKNIYFDNSILEWSNLFYRVGSGSTNVKEDFTLVAGTDNFYYTTTPSKSDISAWHIANNTGWTGSNDIYKTNTGDDYAITKSIAFQQYVVTGHMTIIPTTTSSKGSEDKNNNCDFYTINTPTSGMLTHTATITTPSHGTITISNTDQSLSATSTTANLPHRTILTITATPATGYTCTALTVNGAAFTSGSTHILAADATIAATFTANKYDVTLKPTSQTGSVTDQVVQATYDAAMPTTVKTAGTAIVIPERTGYSFTGWFDNSSGGKQYYQYTGSPKTLSSANAWDKTSATNLYAQWSINSYTLTWATVRGKITTAGTGAAVNATGNVSSSQEYNTALTAPECGSANGYTFTGWSPDVADNMPPANTTYTAQWSANVYTVTLDNQSATTAGAASVSATFGQAMPSIASNLPAKTGYRFDGYYTAKNGGGTKYYNADGSSATNMAMYSANPKLYANWVAQITFSVNGVIDGELTRDDNTAMPSTATVPTACGDCWAFAGWSTDPDEDGAPAYAGGATHEFSAPTTLYAVFGKAEFELITSTSGLVANDNYIIASSTEWALSNVDHSYYTSSSYTHTDAASADISSISKYNASGYYIYNPPASIIWKFTGTKDAGQLYNVVASKYVNLTSTNLLATTQDLKFSIAEDGVSWIIQYSTTNYLHGYTDAHGNGFETVGSGDWEEDDYSAFLYHQTSATYATVPSCDTYTITWKVDDSAYSTGSQTDETNTCAGIEELPEDPDNDELDCAAKFMGWSETKLIGTGHGAPADLFTTIGGAPKVDEDKTFHAVFASVDAENTMEVTDNLTYSAIGLGYAGTGETYTGFENVSSSSSAKYAGQAIRFRSSYSGDGTHNYIQIKSKDSNTGIVTTSSGGLAKKVTITWNTNQSATKAINVYGKNTAYSSPSDLFDNDDEDGDDDDGDLLGTITYGTSTELTIDGDYAYIGLRSSDGAFYIDNIAIKWESAAYKDYMTSCCDELVVLSTNSPSNGTITFAPVSPIATCDANQNVTMTITPNAGYKLSEWSVATGDGKVAASSTSPAVVTGEDNSDEQEIALTFNQHLSGTYAVSATFEQMHDEYYDYMHDNAKVGANRTGSYSAPSRTSKTAGKTANDCKGNHYKFKGWVVSTEINDDGTLKSGYTLITAGTSMTASNKIYYAVWAEEE